MASKHWARWIHASLADYLKKVATDNGLAVLVEGVDLRDPDFSESDDRVEIRVNGPFSQELSKGYHRLYVDVNVLVNSNMGGAQKNAYQLDTILGLYHDAMDETIALYRFGTGPDDDQSLLGCLRPRPGNRDSIKVHRFGQFDTTSRITQGMVDARYVMYLDE